MDEFKKYVCGCECIYNLFRLPKDNTHYVQTGQQDGFEDLYKPSYGTPMPEVIYHDSHRKNCHANTIVDIESFGSCKESPHYNDTASPFSKKHSVFQPCDSSPMTLPPPTLSHIALASDSDSYHSETDTDSLDFIVPETDLPERDVWDIL